MDRNVKDKILSHPRTSQWAKWSPPDLSLEEVRKKYSGRGVSDEELVLRVIAGEAAVKEMIAAGTPKEYGAWNPPLASLIEEISRKKVLRHV